MALAARADVDGDPLHDQAVALAAGTEASASAIETGGHPRDPGLAVPLQGGPHVVPA